MSFYTLLPNGYANLIRTPTFPQPQPRITPPIVQNYKSSLLPVLSQALKISIGNYAMVFQQTTVNKKSSASEDVPKACEKTPIKVDSKRVEDNLDKAQLQKKIEKENISQKVNLVTENTKKEKQNPVQNITNDQPSNSNNEVEASDKKLDSNRKLKRDKIRNKKDIRSVGVPTVSLILTAQLPDSSFTHLQIKKKMQSLLRRQVTTWHQKMKNRRDKREIRMLSS